MCLHPVAVNTLSNTNLVVFLLEFNIYINHIVSYNIKMEKRSRGIDVS